MNWQYAAPVKRKQNLSVSCVKNDAAMIAKYQTTQIDRTLEEYCTMNRLNVQENTNQNRAAQF